MIEKCHSSAFHDTDLHARLSQLGIDHQAVAGLQTEYCIALIQRVGPCRAGLSRDLGKGWPYYVQHAHPFGGADHHALQSHFGWQPVRAATESLAHNKKLTLTTSVDKPLPIGLGDEQRLT